MLISLSRYGLEEGSEVSQSNSYSLSASNGRSNPRSSLVHKILNRRNGNHGYGRLVSKEWDHRRSNTEISGPGSRITSAIKALGRKETALIRPDYLQFTSSLQQHTPPVPLVACITEESNACGGRNVSNNPQAGILNQSQTKNAAYSPERRTGTLSKCPAIFLHQTSFRLFRARGSQDSRCNFASIRSNEIERKGLRLRSGHLAKNKAKAALSYFTEIMNGLRITK